MDARNGQHHQEKLENGCLRLVHFSTSGPDLLSKVTPFSDSLIGLWSFGGDRAAKFRIQEQDCRLFMVQGDSAGMLSFLGCETFEAGLYQQETLVVVVQLRQVGAGRINFSVRAPNEESFRSPRTANKVRAMTSEAPLPRAEAFPACAPQALEEHICMVEEHEAEHSKGGCAILLPDPLGLGAMLGTPRQELADVSNNAGKDVGSALEDFVFKAALLLGYAVAAPGAAAEEVQGVWHSI